MAGADGWIELGSYIRCYSQSEILRLNLLIALIKSPIDPTDINGQKTFFLKI